MALTDKAIRGKYMYLLVAKGMSVMRDGPTRQDLEDQIEDLIEENPRMLMPEPELFTKPGAVMGRIITMVHNIFYNFELRDHRERKAEEAARAAGN